MIRIALAAALMLAAGAASATLVDIRYDFPPSAGVAITWGAFGGEYAPLTGHILSTTLVIDYVASDTQDAADFFFTFDVPTYDGAQTYIGLTGADLGWSGSGEFRYTFTSDLYNGEIRPGRFGAQFDGGGALVDSYIEFTVDADALDPVFADGFEVP